MTPTVPRTRGRTVDKRFVLWPYNKKITVSACLSSVEIWYCSFLWFYSTGVNVSVNGHLYM